MDLPSKIEQQNPQNTDLYQVKCCTAGSVAAYFSATKSRKLFSR